jgi:hypothetical protein
MKNNLYDKKFIESSNVYNFHCEFAWLTQVHSFFYNQMFFLPILSFNIELIQD